MAVAVNFQVKFEVEVGDDFGSNETSGGPLSTSALGLFGHSASFILIFYIRTLFEEGYNNHTM